MRMLLCYVEETEAKMIRKSRDLPSVSCELNRLTNELPDAPFSGYDAKRITGRGSDRTCCTQLPHQPRPWGHAGSHPNCQSSSHSVRYCQEPRESRWS